nr:MAG TPA: hypothetical protein [Caudoviricetes sp.]
MWCRNREGYKDYTAGIAIAHASRDERKELDMTKKRSCRRTVDEDRIHEKAVKVRKMTDEQLVHYIEDRVEKARSEGFNHGKAHSRPKVQIDVQSIVDEIGMVKGIGAGKLADIKAILEKRLAGKVNG